MGRRSFFFKDYVAHLVFDRVRVCTGRRGVLLPDEQLRAARKADRAAHDRAEPLPSRASCSRARTPT